MSDSTYDRTPAPDGPADLPAVVAGRYELRGEIARGGMGVVYRAWDAALHRDVAVKLLQAKYAPGSLAARRFLYEAQITGQLQHPGVPPVHDVGALPDGRPFLAMKLVKGRTLDEILAERGSPNLLPVFEAICQAVGFAHNRGVVHRDLKPANVMVGAFGEVQVMDWGLAKFRSDATHDTTDASAASTFYDPRSGEDDDSHTRAGSALGTPAYMPPEQAIGAVDQIDERSDVFGLGGILCAILTGKPPFVGDTAESTRQLAARGQVGDAFARLDGCGADPDLITLAKRCLAAEQAARPADAGAVAKEVAALRTAADERARRAELERAAAEARATEQRKRRRVQAALGMTLTAAVGLAGFGLWWEERRAAAAEADRAARRSRTTASVEVALREARDRMAETWNLFDYPDRMQAAADAAVAALRRAEGFVTAGEPSDATLADLAAVRASLDDLTRHVRYVADISRHRQQFATAWVQDVAESKLALTRRIEQTLQAIGVAPLERPPDEIARAVVSSRVRDSLLGVLVEWEFHALDRGVKSRLGEVIRATRLACGGAYARWQELLDRKDSPGLVAFAASPEGASFRAELVSALGRDLYYGAKQTAAWQMLMKAAVDRYPHDVWLRYDLAEACYAIRPPDHYEALRHLAVASAMQPDSSFFQMQLGNVYAKLGAFDQAVRAHQEAITLSKGAGRLYAALGATLAQRGDREAAAAAYREAAERSPDNPVYAISLMNALARSGETGKALAAMRMALAEHPAWATRPGSQVVYNSAINAVRTATKADTGALTPADCVAHRKQALDWLEDDLAAWRKYLAADWVKYRDLVHRWMRHWLTGADLQPVRHPMALAFLPADERAAWRKLWADVRALRDATRPRELAPPPRPAKK